MSMSDSDSSSSDSDFEDDAQDLDTVIELQKQVAANPRDYEAHVALISALKLTRESGALAKAREAFAKEYPLTESMWLDWIASERRVMASHAEMEALFRRAVEDYRSVEIWVQFGEYMATQAGAGGVGSDAVRSVFEDAIVGVGMHLTQGHRIWTAFRQFEMQHLERLKTQNADSQAIQKQVKAIRALWMRQCRLPLLGCDDLLQQFEQWEQNAGDMGQPVDDAIRSHIAKGEEWLALRRPLEAAVEQAGENSGDDVTRAAARAAAWREYLVLELAHADVGRIVSLYERILVDSCLASDIWLEYVLFLVKTAHRVGEGLRAVKRAVRNCPWDVSLWSEHVTLVERNNGSIQTLTECFDAASQAGCTPAYFYTVVAAFLDSCRRVGSRVTDAPDVTGVDTAFQHGLAVLEQIAPGTDESQGFLFAFYRATTLLSIVPATKREWAAQQVAEVAKQSTDSSVALRAVTIVRYAGFIDLARSILQRVVGNAPDAEKEQVLQELIQFEREVGTLASFDAAYDKASKLMTIRQSRQQKQMAEEAAAKQQHALQRAKMAEAKEASRKRSREEEGSSNKRSRGAGEAQGADGSDGAAAANAKQPLANLDGEYTLFVSNLPEDVTEESIKAVFEARAGAVAKIRFPSKKRQEGAGKICYVDMGDKAGFEAGMALNRISIGGHVIFVTRSRSAKFNDLLAGEHRTVYVSNLPSNTSEQDLETLFKDCIDGVHGVRLVRNLDGSVRGFAYVDFKSKQGALEAEKLNGTILHDQPVSVALSRPPRPGRNAPRGGGGGGGGAAENGNEPTRYTAPPPQRAPIKTAIMVPRAARKRIDTPAGSAATAKPSTAAAAAGGGSAPASSGGMSNRDFANLFKKAPQ